MLVKRFICIFLNSEVKIKKFVLFLVPEVHRCREKWR